MFELFEHTADLGLRIGAATFDELLVESARGLLSILVANPDAVGSVQTRSITLAGEEPTYLLFDWLNELLYAFETDKLLFATFELHWREGQLVANCHGERMDPRRHQMEHEVKAITYHALRVEQTVSGWRAEVIVDI